MTSNQGELSQLLTRLVFDFVESYINIVELIFNVWFGAQVLFVRAALQSFDKRLSV